MSHRKALFDRATLARQLGVSALIFSKAGTFNNPANTGENTLLPSVGGAAYSLPASLLTTDGDMIRVKASGILAAVARSRTVKLYLGGTFVSIVTSTNTHVSWSIEVEHLRVDATNRITRWSTRVGLASGNDGVVQSASGTGAMTWANAQDIKITGQVGVGAVANDIVGQSLSVEFWPYAGALT
jgi:hypothetical protein